MYYSGKVRLQLLTITSPIKTESSELHIYLTSYSLSPKTLLIAANPVVSPTLQNAQMTDCWTYGIVSKTCVAAFPSTRPSYLTRYKSEFSVAAMTNSTVNK
jgi:hypothetical protein